jgi:hypothetical protein
MKNLQSFGVQELNSKEIKKIQGGGWLAYALGILTGAMIKAGEGLERSGFNSAGANK